MKAAGLPAHSIAYRECVHLSQFYDDSSISAKEFLLPVQTKYFVSSFVVRLLVFVGGNQGKKLDCEAKERQKYATQEKFSVWGVS